MRMSRLVWSVPAGVALAASLGALPAHAASYAPRCTVTPSNADTGSAVSIIGKDFGPGVSVTVSTSGSAVVVSTNGVTDSSGSLTLKGKAGAPGKGTFTLSSATGSTKCSVVVDPAAEPTIVQRTTTPTPTLPNTGASGVGLELTLGGGLVAAGAAALVLTRRRSA